MATTVNDAFAQFMKDIVNLDADIVATARSSRDWLLRQLDSLPDSHSEFPKLYPEVHLHYGSFARRTKIRELDDVDLIVGLSALGTTYTSSLSGVELTVPDGIALRKYCYDGTNSLNSRKVINLFISYLSEIPQYNKAELKQNGSAAVLNLTSYDWVFDIVPAFFTAPEWDGRTYYIIPDGNGGWMKTDPRIDRDRTTEINQKHEGNILNLIRIIKYWNKRATMPTISSYFLECLILQYYQSASSASSYIDVELPGIFTYISSAIYQSLSDPKQVQGDINTLSWDQRQAIAVKASADASKAALARSQESANQMSQSIGTWREIFGSEFPGYN